MAWNRSIQMNDPLSYFSARVLFHFRLKFFEFWYPTLARDADVVA